MVNTLFLWTALFIAALLMEMGGPGFFYFFSLAIGCGAAAVTSYLNYDLVTQLAVCLGATCFSLLVLRSLIKGAKQHHELTNMEGLIGQKAMVYETILPAHPGSVKIYGDIWLAREKNNQTVVSGDIVTITDIQGCHLIVKK